MQEFRAVEIGKVDLVVAELQPEPTLDWAAIDKLMIDDSYQRPMTTISWKTVKNIANNFDWGRFTPLLVSPIAGGFFAVIDGQHRSHAAKLVGHDRVPAMIVKMTPTEQAAAFSWVNGNVTAMSAYHILKAALAAGDQWALESRMVVETSGCKLMTYYASSSSKKPKQIYSVNLIRKYVEAKKGPLVAKVLSAVASPKSKSGDDLLTYTVNVFGNLLWVIDNNPRFSTVDLVEFCEVYSLPAVWRQVQVLRGQVEYFGTSQQLLMRKSFNTLLNQFVGKTNVEKRAPPANSIAKLVSVNSE